MPASSARRLSPSRIFFASAPCRESGNFHGAVAGWPWLGDWRRSIRMGAKSFIIGFNAGERKRRIFERSFLRSRAAAARREEREVVPGQAERTSKKAFPGETFQA